MASGAQPRDGALGRGDGRVAQPPRWRYPAGRVQVDLEDQVALGGPDDVPGVRGVPVRVAADPAERLDAGDGRLFGGLVVGVEASRRGRVTEDERVNMRLDLPERRVADVVD